MRVDRFVISSTLSSLLLSSASTVTTAFSTTSSSRKSSPAFANLHVQSQHLPSSSSRLYSSIGLGPDKRLKTEEPDDDGEGTPTTNEADDDAGQEDDDEPRRELVAGVDYEIPDHESFRTSRRSKLDEQCDAWFSSLLGSEDDKGVLGPLADDARNVLMTPVELVNEEALPKDDEEWTPYVSTKLPWQPLLPAFGLEEFGLPTPRRNAETWRHFDVAGMVGQDYSGSCDKNGDELDLSEEEVSTYRKKLEESGGWLSNDECQARLVYINGRFVPELSRKGDLAENIGSIDDSTPEEVTSKLERITDGFTDDLVTPVPIGQDEYATSYKTLSGPDHKLGSATSQFAINTQQGTACFAALNTRRTGAVAYVHAPNGYDKQLTETEEQPKPVLILNAVTKNGGAAAGCDGMSFHPRCVVVAEENSRLSVVQSCVDLDDGSEHVPKLYNGYTQFFVYGGANVTHSYLEESGGVATAQVELSDDAFEEGEPIPRFVEAERPELKDTHLECVDVHVAGEEGSYEGTIMSFGGSGRVRIAQSVSLLKPGAHAKLNGFSLSGGAQRTDCKTNIHHVAQGTTSEQVQKNMIGGRATGAFRGRIRVEQSAQQTDSQQLSRTVLLSDRSRAWAVPSLEIIADDVSCTHGATVSDLSEEELFYLRSRGIDRAMARNLLMYAFAGDVCSCVDPAMITTLDSDQGLQKRVIDRLQNVVPQGDRAVKGEFQSV
eukprot:CAMPEP_0113440844 /NCGR_PEP_ID=MMETSP0014_2-20120614/769_1 /TAXON_ID=2857 /ORGANISM="Nitzschia sp." /LENGTH=717 /DNA_ID=CAMNT_0000331655 /DNA_START=134 /DNA_END=2287 /DNA_ORIENTATION=- /assembly_acc=CAM_ASM_000159